MIGKQLPQWQYWVFAELEQGGWDGPLLGKQLRDLVDHMVAELVRHSVAEEQYLYPAVRKYLEGGDAIADHEIAAHTQVERLLHELEDMLPTESRFSDLISELIGSVREHVADEENDLLPKLEEACPPNELYVLGQKVLRAKETAPTRPHPSAPKQPPANLILAPGAGRVDKVRDRISGRAT